jgi:hypothetical protein
MYARLRADINSDLVLCIATAQEGDFNNAHHSQDTG